MAVKTTAQQLEEVQAAITAAQLSQAMGSGTDRIDRPDLKVLYEREDVLLKRLAAETGSANPAINTGIIAD